MKPESQKNRNVDKQKDSVYDLTNLSQALDVLEDGQSKSFDFNKLSEALSVAEEKKNEEKKEKQREERLFRFREICLKKHARTRMEKARKKSLSVKRVRKLRSLAVPKLQKNEKHDGLPVIPHGENGFPAVIRSTNLLGSRILWPSDCKFLSSMHSDQE